MATDTESFVHYRRSRQERKDWRDEMTARFFAGLLLSAIGFGIWWVLR